MVSNFCELTGRERVIAATQIILPCSWIILTLHRLPEKAEDNPFQAVVLFLEDFFALKELNTPQNEDVKIKEAHGKEVLREQTIHSAETNNVSVTDDKSSATSQPRASFKLGGLPVEQLNSAWLRDAMQFPFSCVDQITSSSERVISCFESPEPQSKQQPTKDM